MTLEVLELTAHN